MKLHTGGSIIMNISAKRFRYLDIARGIAMISIVLGHLGVSDINRVVFTYHLPIFYLITGYFLKTSGTKSAFIRKKLKL